MSARIFYENLDATDDEINKDIGTGEFKIVERGIRHITVGASSCAVIFGIGETKVIGGHFTNLMRPQNNFYDGDVFREALVRARTLSETHPHNIDFYVLGGTPHVENGIDTSAADFYYVADSVKTAFPHSNIIVEKTIDPNKYIDVMVDEIGRLVVQENDK